MSVHSSSIAFFMKLMSCSSIDFFFFFQAEDGIRDDLVTGVQTCALPISCSSRLAGAFRSASCRSACLRARRRLTMSPIPRTPLAQVDAVPGEVASGPNTRSEERRVGEEGRSRWAPYHLKKKRKNNDGEES